MSRWSTQDWSLATFISYATGTLSTATKVNRKSVFYFQEQDRLEDYSLDELKALYYSNEGAAIGSARELLNAAKDIKRIALAAKEEE